MSDKPRNRTVIDLVNGDSDFAANGFAALNEHMKPKEEDDKSNDGDSLDGDSLDGDSLFGGRDDAPAQKSPYFGSAQHHTPAERSPYFNNVQVKQESIEKDDDGDFMIVDEADVPAHVKAKFAVRSWRPRTPDLEITAVKVKQEPDAAPARPQATNLNNGTADPKVKDERRSENDSLFGDDEDHEMASNDNLGAKLVADAAAYQDDDEAMFVDELDEPAIEDLQMEMDNILENVFEKEADAEAHASRIEAPARRAPENVATPVAGGPFQPGNRSGTAGPSHASVRGADDPGKAHDISAATAAPHIDLPRSDALTLSGAAGSLSGSLFGADDAPGIDNHFQADASHRFETPSAVFLDFPAVSTGSSGNAGVAGLSGPSGHNHDDGGGETNVNDDDDDDDGGEGVDAENGMDVDGIDGHADDEELDGNDVEFVLRDDEQLSDGERPRQRSRRRKAMQKKKGKAPAQAAGEASSLAELAEMGPEDLKDELDIALAEQRAYALRKAKGKLGPGDEDRLEGLNQRCSNLRELLSKLEPSMADFANEELRKMVEADDMENNDVDTAERDGHAESSKTADNRIPVMVRRDLTSRAAPSAQKRKWKPMPQSAEARAKKRRPASGEGETTEAILSMVMSQDPIAARALMDDENVFASGTISASTVKEQMAKLQEEIDANPDADKRRVREDVKKLTWARKLFGGKRYCKPDNGMWSIKGLTKPLHHYQLFGAGWMLHRELHPDGPFGGILADSVGLGKTIEALACILGNRRPDEEKSDTKLGTLIVVPPNLLAQWQDETDVCCPDLRVTRYHSSKHNRVRMSDLLRADIVLTSYYEVMKAYPNKDKLKEWRDLPEAERSEKFEQALGWLFGIEWHRVILDEAHCIKNSRTHTFNACSQLRGKYRWAMTATPVHNGLQEVYPYAKFLRESNAESFKDVKHKNPVRRTEAKQQMQKWLDEVMMIRHIQTLFMGKALFKIPKTNPLPNIWIKLSEEEFFIYRHVENKIREKINERLSENMTPEEKKACKLSFLVLAIRLRQAVTHPFLLFLMMRDLFELEDVQLIRRELEQIRLRHPDRPFIEQIGSWCETTIRGKLEGKVTDDARESPFGKGNHGLYFDMDTQFAKLEDLKTNGVKDCGICSEPLRMPRHTKCGHVFCRECLIDLVQDVRHQGHNTIECPTCEQEHALRGFISGTVTHATSESQSRPRNRRDKDWNADMPGNDYKEYQPMGDEEGGRFLEECDKNVNLALTPSAKTTVVKNLILDWQRDHPDDKIIVFTQWVLLGRILGRVLQQEGINFLYYFGEMSREEKEDNVKVFHNVPDVKVMVASLKCGGQGLNLTCANRVILIDPWWNSALEHQAYGRVFRMGQPKETYFVRLLTKKTIDGRMAKLQHKKLIEIKEMIKPYDTTQRNPKFREVVELFGRVECDKNGKMVAVVDDYDSDDEDTPVNVPNGLGRMGMGLRRGGRVAVGNGEGSNAAADGREDDIDELLDMPRELGPGDSRVGGYGIQDL